MKIYSIDSKKNIDITDVKKDSKNLIFICDHKEITTINNMLDIDVSHLKIHEYQDEYISHRSYDDYDLLSLMFISLNNSHLIYRIFFSDTFLIISAPHIPVANPDHDFMVSYLDTKIKNLFSKSKNLKPIFIFTKTLYNFFDVFIQRYSLVLEMLEDKIEKLNLNIPKAIADKNFFAQINELNRLAYSIKKHIRAIDNIIPSLENNYNEFLSKELSHILSSLRFRLNTLLKFSESVYSFAEQLSNNYHTHMSMQTNILVTRLTCLTIIFSVWTVVVGIYGMNFVNMPEIDWEYGYFIVIGSLIVITIILLIIFRKKKWI